jgi:hypothetical protein
LALMQGIKFGKPKRHGDHRGIFAGTYSIRKYSEPDIGVEILRDNHSLSRDVCTFHELYFIDGTASKRAKQLKRTAQCEFEIRSLLDRYLKQGNLTVEKIGRGFVWLDTGIHGSFLDEGNVVRTITQ